MRLATILLAVTSIVIAAQPDSYDRALKLYDRTGYKDAIAALIDAPPDARSLELLGRCYLMDAQYRKATEVLEKAVALEPNNSMTVLWLGRAYGRRAETSFPVAAIGWATKARQSLEKAVQLNPANADAVDDLFDFYLAAPGMIGGGLDKARGLIPVIAKRDPAEADFDRARVAEEQKEFGTAEAHLRRAMELAPKQVGRVLELAKFLAKQGRFAESEKTFDKATQMAPDSPKVLFTRADTYVRTKRNLDQARTLLNQYLASTNLTPDDPSRDDALRLLRKAEGR